MPGRTGNYDLAIPLGLGGQTQYYILFEFAFQTSPHIHGNTIRRSIELINLLRHVCIVYSSS